MARHITHTAAILLIAFHITKCSPAKSVSRPVHEIINEQARIDDVMRAPTAPGNLPYGNPLAGNSKQNARLHAQNQQAMFNAERVRQHRAQLQRWTKAPQQVDSYMKAYHESQESHQLAVEKQQAIIRDHRQISNKHGAPGTKNIVAVTKHAIPVTKHYTVTTKHITPVTKQIVAVTKAPMRLRQGNMHENPKGVAKVFKAPEITKITKEDAVINPEKNRNHRSFGSVKQQHIQTKRFQTVHVSPGPTYDQGVTIKPNGNAGLTTFKSPEELKLYTSAVPSKTQYVYPKQYNQMQNYQSAHDIDALRSLLTKDPSEQLTELSSLLNSNQHEPKPQDTQKDTLDTPIDLYFYLKNHQQQTLGQHEQIKHVPGNIESYATPQKDFTPITEELDDIEDPNKNARLKAYGVQPILATQAPIEIDTTTTRNSNYYKIEVASQTVSAPYSANKYHYNVLEEAKPTYQTLQYAQPTYAYGSTDADLGEKYLHHNAQQVGIHHLTGDGTGISAYSEDNLQYAASYEFGYRVKDPNTGNDFGHHEAKLGDNTKGHYHVLLPDGRLQKVKYTADSDGFHADVSYDHLLS